MTVSVIVSKGRCAEDGSRAIRGCDETTISDRRRRGPRRRGAEWHRRIGDAPIPVPRGLYQICLSLPLRGRAGWGHGDTNPDRDADTGTHTGDGHDPGAGLPTEHGARL